MKNNGFINRFKHIPIGSTGLGLGIGGLGSLWTAVLQDACGSSYTNNVVLSIVQYFCIFFTILMVSLVLLRNAAHKGTFSSEIKHPLLSSFIPTVFMSLMVIAGFIGYVGKLTNNKFALDALVGIGSILWYIAIIGHLIIFILFLIFIIRNHKIKSDNLYASWFVPPVGIIVSCTVASPLSASTIMFIPNELFQALWYFGVCIYFLTLPIVAYKLIFHRAEDKNTFPSVAIFGAPANLSLAGFLDVFVNSPRHPLYYNQTFINVFIMILSFLAVATTLVIYLLLPRILSMRFIPVFASLTFPLAIGATAIFKTSVYIDTHLLVANNSNYLKDLFWATRIIAYIELAIATLTIIYVLTNYLILIFKKVILSEKQAPVDAPVVQSNPNEQKIVIVENNKQWMSKRKSK